MGLRNDYRVSTIIVLCKDCGNDVGLYPARHKCTNVKRPHLPTLCSSTSDWPTETVAATAVTDVPDLVASSPISTTVTRQASDSSLESGKWSFFKSNTATSVKYDNEDNEPEEPTYYFDNYTSNLKSSISHNDINELATTPISNGKKLWGRMKENEKWKELIAEKKKDEKTSGKLWSRIINATLSNALEEQNHDAGPDSDDDDWEGETHVSRILREHHQSKYKNIPSWLYDDRVPILTMASTPVEELESKIGCSRTIRQSGRRLWHENANTAAASAREKERQALRSKSYTISRTQSERKASAFSNKKPLLRSSALSNTTLYNEEDSQLYGSITPRRTNTTRLPSSQRSHYLDNNNMPPAYS